METTANDGVAQAAASNGNESTRSTISREMVRLYKELFGRGPTKASTHMWDDVILCTLEESLTRAERNMAEMGEHQRLRDVRMFFQYASEGEFRSVIEQITGRKVRAFVSGMDSANDVASEVFYLEPLQA